MNNPYGHYRRHNTPAAEHMAALWKEVAREHVARSSSARQHARDCHDSMDAAIRRANKAEFDAATYRADHDDTDGGVAAAAIEEAAGSDSIEFWQSVFLAEQRRAEKAEEERDEARRYECSDLDAHWRLGEALASLKEANATVASLRAEQPRALTPDAITDSHVLSARLKANALGWFGRFDAPAEEWRQVLTAALTEPPSRPEWEDAPYVWADSAQGGGRVIWKRSTSDDGRVIWSSGGTWRPSWMLTNPAPVVPEGVRVVTEKEARHATDE